MKIESFLNGDARLFTLSGGDGLRAEITNFGGVIRSLCVPASDGREVNVALGCADPEDYRGKSPYFGALVGRVGNRIGGSSFMLNGRQIRVAANEGKNSLHGGLGYSYRLWEVAGYEDSMLHLHLRSFAGDAGYPGNLDVDAVYRMTADNALEVVMTAVTDAPTAVNLTNHNYFNLAGEETGSLLDQSLRIFASRRQEVDAELIPTGKCPEVSGTPWDFRKMRSFEQAFLEKGGGFDDNYILDHPRDGVVRTAACAYSARTGIRLTVEGNAPCVQLYTGGGLSGDIRGTSGLAYPALSAFCLEMQGAVDAPNQPGMPGIFLMPGEVYRQVIRYRFDR